MSSKKIHPYELAVSIGDILRDFEDDVYNATEEGLTRAEKILINNLKADSPEGPSKKYRRAWKSKGKKYKMRRYVGNTKTVQGKSGEIPLANILEYGSESPHKGRIKKTYEESLNQMVDAVKKEIEEGV